VVPTPGVKRVRTQVAFSRRSHSPPPPTRRSGPVCRLDDGRTRIPRTRLPCSYATGRNLPSLSLPVTSGFSFGRTDGAPSAPGPLSRIFDVADSERALDRKLGSTVGNPTWLRPWNAQPSQLPLGQLPLGQLPLGRSLLRPPRKTSLEGLQSGTREGTGIRSLHRCRSDGVRGALAQRLHQVEQAREVVHGAMFVNVR
jgi:hypothetical protein